MHLILKMLAILANLCLGDYCAFRISFRVRTFTCLLVNGTNQEDFTQLQITPCRQSLADSWLDILLLSRSISRWHVNIGVICQVLLNKCSPDPGKMSLIFRLHICLNLLSLLIIIWWFTFSIYIFFFVWDMIYSMNLGLEGFLGGRAKQLIQVAQEVLGVQVIDNEIK